MMILHHHLQQQPNNIGIDDYLRYHWYVDYHTTMIENDNDEDS